MRENTNVFVAADKEGDILLTEAEFLLYAVEFMKINPEAKAKKIGQVRRKRFRNEWM